MRKMKLTTDLDSKTFRDFFSENKGKSLKDESKCWKYKKSIQGHNCYEKADLIVLYNDV